MNTNWGWYPGYGYLWWVPERGYLAWGFGGQFIVVVPELNLVIGTHSTEQNANFSQKYFWKTNFETYFSTKSISSRR